MTLVLELWRCPDNSTHTAAIPQIEAELQVKYGLLQLYRLGKKEDSDPAAGHVRGGGESRTAAGGGGHGTAGPPEGNALPITGKHRGKGSYE